MVVDRAGRGEAQQSQCPGGGTGQFLVDQPEDPGQRARVRLLRAVLRVGVHPLGEVGDGRLGAGGEPATGQHQRGRVALARLHQALGGARVHGDADRAGVAGEQFEGGLGVQAAQGAGADVRDAGERALGDGHHQAVRGVREQGVDLFGAGRVVQEEELPAVGEGGAQGLGEVVLGGAGRGGHTQRAEQFAGGPLDRYGGAVGLGEPGAQHPVGVTVGDLADEFLGEGGAP